MRRNIAAVLALWAAIAVLPPSMSIAALASTPPHFNHVVLVIQENRTPDNLFGGNPAFEQASILPPADSLRWARASRWRPSRWPAVTISATATPIG